MKNWRDDSALKIRGSTAWAIFGSDSHLTLEQLKCLELLYSDWRICVTCLKTVWQVWCHGQRSRKRRWENSALKLRGSTGETFLVKNWWWENFALRRRGSTREKQVWLVYFPQYGEPHSVQAYPKISKNCIANFLTHTRETYCPQYGKPHSVQALGREALP